MYVDLQSIIDEESRYQDPGAYAIENLFLGNKGLFDWDTQDDDLSWNVTYQLFNWETEEFGEELQDNSGNDVIESTHLDKIGQLTVESLT